ncbi:myosin light chain kinase 3 isoform X2 [Brienomyrus brachyistius]|uniref:myosin light chain kinase 3 isoform X2 n=1 Tax=Brienomyrus brachyistius TaxID=42636 RepID=UPI0020B238F3|nr:myosin light chain kinase 3 isoform X2 [Brienomyrus brachyistius]
MSKQATLANCIAKMYEGGKLDNGGKAGPVPGAKKPANTLLSSLGSVEVKLNLLEAKVEQISDSQAEVLKRLDLVCRGIGSLEREVVRLGQEKEVVAARRCQAGILDEVRTLCGETVSLLQSLQQENRHQREKMEGIGRSVSTTDKVLAYLADIFRSSRIVDFILRGSVPQMGATEEKDKSDDKSIKPKFSFCDKGTQVGPDTEKAAENATQTPSDAAENRNATDISTPGQSRPMESHPSTAARSDKQGGDVSAKVPRRPKEVTHKSREPTRTQTFAKDALEDVESLEVLGRDVPEQVDEVEGVCVGAVARLAESEPQEAKPTELKSEAGQDVTGLDVQEVPVPELVVAAECRDLSSAPSQGQQDTTLSPAATSASPAEDLVISEMPEVSGGSTGTESQLDLEPKLEVILQPSQADQTEQVPPAPTVTKQMQPEVSQKDLEVSSTRQLSPTTGAVKRKIPESHLIIDDCPPQPAPFEHRIVSAKQVPMGTYYAVKTNEVLGGGRFGQVHKCAELSSGLTLAAKIIKVKGMKNRDEVKNEIGVMNQLNHVNLIQLYDAFESRTNLTLIMEYVEGGELFDRIVDENYQLTELDAIVFTRQICEGVQYLHQQYILHLDLKPENILCVSATGNQIKIIDFGLARKYRPREKLKVNFGTPEFLAPEVVNYDFVSFPTDMWSVGVITYMLLSGLSPFLGDNDTETMNNILHSNWDFDADAFENISEEAKDFISRLLISEKCGRLSASGCMKHSWLNNLEEKARMKRVRLKSHLYLQCYLAAHRQWKKHFYAVAAANRLKRMHSLRSMNPA